MCVLLWAGFVNAQHTPAHTPTPAKSTLADLNGSPLPPGAVARIGSLSLRHGEVTDFIFAPDGRTLLSVGMDGYLRRFDLNSGKQIGCTLLNADHESFTRLTLSVDGKIILAEKRTGNLASKGRFSLFDAATGRLIKALESSAPWMIYRELSPDSRHISAATWVRSSPGNRMHARTLLIDWDSGQERDLLISHPDETSTVAFGGMFASNGLWYAVAGDQRQPLRVIEYRTGKQVCSLGAQINSTSVFSHDSKLLAVVSVAKNEADHKPYVRIFRVPTGEQVGRFPIEVAFDELTFSHDGKMLAGSTDKQIQIIELASRKVMKQLTGSASKLRFSFDDRILGALSEDPQLLSSNSDSAKLHFWSVDSGREIHAHGAEFDNLVSTSSNEELIATLNKSVNSFDIWNVAKLKRTIQISLEENQRAANQLKFVQKDRKIYASFRHTQPWKWDVATGKSLGAIVSNNPIELKGVIDAVLSDDATLVIIARPKDGNPLVGDAQPNQLIVWDAITGKHRYTTTIPDSLSSAKWLPGNKKVLLRTTNSFAIVDAVSGKLRSSIESKDSYDLSASRRGWFLASKRVTINPNPVLTIYEAATGKEFCRLPVGRPYSRDELCWIDDRHLLVINGLTAKLWDILTGKVRFDFSAEYEANASREEVRVIQALPLPHKQQLFTVQVDRTGLLWDLAPALKAKNDRGAAIGQAEADNLWRELGSDDPKKAYVAAWRFVESPAALPFLASFLLERKDLGYEKAQALIAKLDANEFQVREQAQRELLAMGNAALAAVRDAQGKKNSAEVIRRLDTLSSAWPAHQLPASVVRRIRTIHVLESINSAASKRLLQDMIEKGLGKIEREEAALAIARMIKPTSQ
jgi:WD40 repeat protein